MLYFQSFTQYSSSVQVPPSAWNIRYCCALIKCCCCYSYLLLLLCPDQYFLLLLKDLQPLAFGTFWKGAFTRNIHFAHLKNFIISDKNFLFSAIFLISTSAASSHSSSPSTPRALKSPLKMKKNEEKWFCLHSWPSLGHVVLHTLRQI